MSCVPPPGSCSTSPPHVRDGASCRSRPGDAGGSTRTFSLALRVDPVGTKPPVWRRLDLPSTLRLDELHGVLQAVFGWSDSHLHRFWLGDSAWDDGAERFLCTSDVEEGEDDGVPACVRLDEVLTKPPSSTSSHQLHRLADLLDDEAVIPLVAIVVGVEQAVARSGSGRCCGSPLSTT